MNARKKAVSPARGMTAYRNKLPLHSRPCYCQDKVVCTTCAAWNRVFRVNRERRAYLDRWTL